jgi:DNA-damage-inducible protein J
MSKDIVRARIEPEIKQRASAVLESMGLTVSDAIRMLMTRVATEKAMPVGLLVPNAETIEAIEAARAGHLHTAGKPTDLIASLNEK